MSINSEFATVSDCCDCKFFDGISCMYNCGCIIIADTEESAINCTNFSAGDYDQLLLEKANYK